MLYLLLTPMSNPANSAEQECSHAPYCSISQPSNSPLVDHRVGWQQVLSETTDSDLPTDFPDVEVPRFLYGDRLRWISNHEVTDWGVAIGRFYSFAPHRRHWHWCYLIWLDPDSPSSAWVRADIAWEDDLEPMEEREAR